MTKRYQVFLSSSYEDLKEERLEVMKAILELDCIPCGMEYFPAASEDQWTYIKELIDQCDYYVVVVAGRYGSTGPNGISYTQKEYDYAISQGVPTIAFIHSDPENIPAKFSESTKEGKRKLQDFRKQLQSKLCKEWRNVHELGAVVSRSLTQLIKQNPRPGWVRADVITSAEASEEILNLRKKIEQQNKELDNLRLKAPVGAESLAQGSDKFTINYKVTLSDQRKPPGDRDKILRFEEFLVSTWDEIFSSFASYLLVECMESQIKLEINRRLRVKTETYLLAKYPEYKLNSLSITEDCLQTIKVQFNALGLIDLRMKQIGDELKRMSQLTPLGKKYLINIRAIRKPNKKK